MRTPCMHVKNIEKFIYVPYAWVSPIAKKRGLPLRHVSYPGTRARYWFPTLLLILRDREKG